MNGELRQGMGYHRAPDALRTRLRQIPMGIVEQAHRLSWLRSLFTERQTRNGWRHPGSAGETPTLGV